MTVGQQLTLRDMCLGDTKATAVPRCQLDDPVIALPGGGGRVNEILFFFTVPILSVKIAGIVVNRKKKGGHLST